jgi:hypothetical protein
MCKIAGWSRRAQSRGQAVHRFIPDHMSISDGSISVAIV